MRNDISNICRYSVAAAALTLLSGCALFGGADDTSQAAQSRPTSPAPVDPAETMAPAEPVQLQPAAPMKYVVKKGDTLWDISQKFLANAWQWPELWYVNEQVKNPHLIYPGDVLYLFWADGRPRLAREGDGPPVETYTGPQDKLSPRIRELPVDQAITTIPRDVIAGFLNGPRIIEDEDILDDAPYVLDFEDPHLMNASASDELVYVLEIEDPKINKYQIVRRGKRYVDPDDNDTIGYEAIPVAEAEMREFGDPSTLVLQRSTIETRPGDRLLPIDPVGIDVNFYPHAPAKKVGGTIIDAFNADSQIGQYQIVVLNRGIEQGVEPGHVLTVMQSGRRSVDPDSIFGSKVTLPDIEAGTVMVFKTAQRVSLALVMSAVRQIHVGDKVEKPQPASR